MTPIVLLKPRIHEPLSAQNMSPTEPILVPDETAPSVLKQTQPIAGRFQCIVFEMGGYMDLGITTEESRHPGGSSRHQLTFVREP
ncbi:hypothetical protein V6N11_080796 [Hibiscus sabdariffa]|uniref:Uncharacterized protein n=1 Tax=Hibiscus sabdariffa TaxID=183260 RepID=A0ABR2QHZ2_9ROSI